MTELLREVGEVLCGPYRTVTGGWHSRLAFALNVNPRRVRAWAAGEEPVPEGVWRELYELLRQQAVENARLNYAIMEILYPKETGR